RNNGDGTFKDVTAGSGLEAPGLYMACAVADIDNDGRPDIVLTGYGIVRLFRNAGGGKFVDITKGSGLECTGLTQWNSCVAFGDFDHDGLIDVYVGKYIRFDDTTLHLCGYGQLKSSCGPTFYDPALGALYRNLGNGKFKDVTSQYGLDACHGKSLGAMFADVN